MRHFMKHEFPNVYNLKVLVCTVEGEVCVVRFFSISLSSIQLTTSHKLTTFYLEISIIHSLANPKVIENISISDYLFEIINSNSIYKEGVFRVRNDIPKKNEIKTHLPCALPHGTFSYGNDVSILKFSDHFCVVK